jgi:hypothetical protein
MKGLVSFFAIDFLKKSAFLLFGFLMQGVLFANRTILLQFQTLKQNFLVLVGMIVSRLANRAFHFDHVLLGHKY